MKTIRKITDQLFDRKAKKDLRKSCQLLHQECELELPPLGSDEDFSTAHDIIIQKLSKIGSTTEEPEYADFILNRYEGDMSRISIVCDRYSAKIILAVRSSQQQFPKPYPVHLDCDEAEITILNDGRVFGSTVDKEDTTILKHFGFTTNNH